MTKIGKHQLENDYFFISSRDLKEGSFQKFDDTVKKYEKIHISTLAMDFQNGTSKKERGFIEKEWIERLPTLNNIKHISIRHRVNQEYFDAICKMKNLESIFFLTSSIEDISQLKNLTKLISISLGSFSKLTNISSLTEITTLKSLSIENCFKVENYEEIGKMEQLIALSIEGDTFAPKNLILKSLKPFNNLNTLKHLDLSTTSIKDKSFAEILKMENLVRLDASWRMKNEIREKIKNEHKSLKSGFFMVYDFKKNEFYDGIEWWKN